MSPNQFPVGSLTVFDAQTGTELSTVKSGNRSVSWSPDSKRLCYIPPSGSQATDRLFYYRQIMSSNLIMMDPDGGNPQTIYDVNADGYVDWRP
jgi:Tol biopolymer transport system component